MKKLTTEKIINKLLTDRLIRLATVKESHYWFFYLYMNHYVTVETAMFQREMFSLTEDANNKMMVVVAFRGSAKSTIMGLSYPLWAIMGKLEKKYVLLISQTQAKAQTMLQSIKSELEKNQLLKGDLGPFKEEPNQWGSQTLVLTKFNARIATASVEQSVRGTRHNQYRPDLIIVDDIEDLQSVKTKEGRDKSFNWLMGEVLPAGDMNTVIVVIGNLLHQDSVIKRLEAKINENKIRGGVYKAYPLIDENGVVLWPSRYPTYESIEDLKNTYDAVTFNREFMLKILPAEDQVVREEWIQYYDSLPPENYRYEKMGVDLAISTKTTADYTAAVSARVYGYDKDMKIYILPSLINKRMEFPEAIEHIKLSSSAIGGGKPIEILVEEVAYQSAFTQQLKSDGYPSKGVKIGGSDKLSRLSMTTYLIKSGRILFPKNGTEELISQMVGFGIEKHDDLVDAFTLLINEIILDKRRPASFGIWEHNKEYYGMR